jgi:beta-phosphoglucomutase-like phosphatase (HAD superfamily)
MTLSLPLGLFSGYIFDCDGTLADSMPVHYQAWLQALAAADAPFHFEEEHFYQLGGTATSKIINILNERHGCNLDSETLSHAKELYFMENVSQIQPIDSVVAIARRLAQTHPVSIVTGGFRHVVEQTLETINILHLFPIIITPADVLHGKPAPDMFLLAAEKMGVPARECLVFEDGIVGIEGAEKAGMQSVFIPSRIVN